MNASEQDKKTMKSATKTNYGITGNGRKQIVST
jgi:hypothetical protein